MYQDQLQHLPQVTQDQLSYIIHENAIITGKKNVTPAPFSVIGVYHQPEYEEIFPDHTDTTLDVVTIRSIDYLVIAAGQHEPGDQIPANQARFAPLNHAKSYKSDSVNIKPSYLWRLYRLFSRRP